MTSRNLLLLLTMFGLWVTAPYGFAQPSQPQEPPAQQRELTEEEREALRRQQEEAAKACAVCGSGIATVMIIGVIAVILNIALLIWVARDAKSRGMDSSILWMFLVMFTSILGLIIYIFSRPQGELIRCPHCNGKRLRVSATCPHCRHA